MKKTITLLLIMSNLMALGQVISSVTKPLHVAILESNKNTPLYNPKDAFAIFMAHANQGEAEAMNDVGKAYLEGEGTVMDENVAIKWFEKAAKNGYGKAFYNLGSIYRLGTGVSQDFKKAYTYYKNGALLNDSFSIYEQGYMLYKGLGCHQNYKLAFDSFQKSAGLEEIGSMYMLGVCYRNGYGTNVNSDSAKYWLSKSAKFGYKYAMDELETSNPENPNNNQVINIGSPYQKYITKMVKEGYVKINQHLLLSDIAGDYEGYLVKFDWSGKHIIELENLKLSLKMTDKKITGCWTEDNDNFAQLAGSLSDSTILTNGTYNKVDHYFNQKAPNTLNFVDLRLQMDKSRDTTFILGDLNLYSQSDKEPEKPTYIILARQNKKADIDTILLKPQALSDDSLNMKAYPNPFNNVLNVKFSLKKSSNVRITVTSLMYGTVIYKGPLEQMEPGEQKKILNLSGTAGIYVISLYYGNSIKSIMVFKN